MTHHHAAKMLGTSVDPCDHEIDSGSDDEESVTALEAEATSVVQSQVSTQTYLSVCMYRQCVGIYN